jgi:hypothetical protein
MPDEKTPHWPIVAVPLTPSAHQYLALLSDTLFQGPIGSQSLDAKTRTLVENLHLSIAPDSPTAERLNQLLRQAIEEMNTINAAYGLIRIYCSDRALKGNIKPVDGREILERLSRIPIVRWNFKSDYASVQHIGPMAQDFHAAFGLGDSDRHIAANDADGIALVCIQALWELSREKDQRIDRLEREAEDRRQEIEEFETRLAAVEKAVPAPPAL